ncbi:MAG: TIGR00730 family Rossman fold protein [Muribaculum sp.]
MDKNGIVIYGASSSDVAPRYMEWARATGRAIALSGHTLISGGGRGGLMAAAIDGAIEAGGKTIGVLPEFMIKRGWNHPGLDTTLTTASMHERKKTMADLSCGAIALPGGVGTLDELFEIITWRQLGLYEGNVVIGNAYGFYDMLLAHLRHTDDEHFMRAHGLWSVADTPEEAVKAALDRLTAYDGGEKY